jgi:hypothetical protein
MEFICRRQSCGAEKRVQEQRTVEQSGTDSRTDEKTEGLGTGSKTCAIICIIQGGRTAFKDTRPRTKSIAEVWALMLNRVHVQRLYSKPVG